MGEPVGRDIEELLLAIQSGLLEETPWLEFVRLLRRALNANFANLIFRRSDAPPGETIAVHDAAFPLDPVQTRYRASFVALDPIPYFAMEAGKVYSYDELDGVTALTHDRFRKDFLHAEGFEHLLIFRVSEPGGCSIWVTVTRSEEQNQFLPDERNLCERLARALEPALSCYAALLDRSIETEIYRRAANLLSLGVITLDGDRRIVAMDDAARRRMDEIPDLSVRQGRLLLKSGGKDLQAHLEKALVTNEMVSLHLGDVDGLDLLIVPVMKRPDMGPRTVRLMIYISGRRPLERDISNHLAVLFGLSESQARLAMLLANGRTLAEAAVEIGITEQTARTYSKEIYGRTGTTRQGELIQRILTSVAMLS